MTQRGHLIHISVVLPPAEYRVYISAARILAGIMGAQAPDAAAIMQAQLSGRKPRGIADDHLDSEGWPLERAQRTGRVG
jgi:hypothetical protein